MEPKNIGDIAETVGEVAAEVVKAPFKAVGGFLNGILGVDDF